MAGLKYTGYVLVGIPKVFTDWMMRVRISMNYNKKDFVTTVLNTSHSLLS